MSSDRLSFNQSADAEDDGARWEAYQALLRRTAVPSPEAESSPQFEDGFEEADDRPVEPAFDQSQDQRDEPGLAAEDDPSSRPVHPATDELGPLGDVAAIADDSDDVGLGAWDRPRPPPPTNPPRGRDARLVGAIMALTAGIILAALVLQSQPAQRDKPPPTRVAQVHAVTPEMARPTVQPAAAVARPLPAPPPAPRAVPPTKLVAASAADGLERVGRRTRPDPAAQSRSQPPQCWVSGPNGQPWLTDCPQVAPSSDAAARPDDGYLRLPPRARN